MCVDAMDDGLVDRHFDRVRNLLVHRYVLLDVVWHVLFDRVRDLFVHRKWDDLLDGDADLLDDRHRDRLRHRNVDRVRMRHRHQHRMRNVNADGSLNWRAKQKR